MVFLYMVRVEQPIVCYNSPTIYFLALLESSSLKPYFLRFFCFERVSKNLQQCLLWTENVKVTCGKCGTSVTKKHLSRHKSSCIGGTLYCPKCPNFCIKSRDDLNYHIVKKHSATGPKNNYTCKECSIEFPSFYSLRHHKQRYHTAETTSSGKKV